MKTIEIWIAMDSDGDFAISTSDDSDAVENYCSEIGGSLPLRVVKFTINMSPPEVTEVAELTVPDSAGHVDTSQVSS